MTSIGPGSPREVVEAMYAAANRNDLDAQVACFAADATYRFDTYGVDVAGRVALRQVVDRFLETFPDRQITVIAVICEGERVCVEYDYAATSPGGVPGPAAVPVARRAETAVRANRA
jgi:ketosteroid isomerase-like protein